MGVAGGGVQVVQTIFLVLLVFVAGFAGLARRLNIPYPIVLVVAGLLLSFVPGIPRIPLNPELIFFVFLPPLLYSAAWTLSWREFQRNIGRILMLAIGLVAFSVFGLAWTAGWLLPGFDWRSGFLLGAIVAATDAIAATAIARRVGLPLHIVEVLEAESLVNDGTGLLAFQFGLLILTHNHHPGVVQGTMRLFYLIGGGVAVGLAIGAIVAWFEKWVDDAPIEIVVSILVPYVAYLSGNAMHASGVLAVIACGMYMSRKSVEFFTPNVRLQTAAVWSALTFVLNGIVFVLIGLQLPYVVAEIPGVGRVQLIEYGVGFSAVMILIRVVWVFGETYGAYALQRWGFGEPATLPEPKSVFIIGWSGMRGVLSLAAAISLPYTLPGGAVLAQRSMILFLTFCLILTTLVLQGLTLPWVIRRTGLAHPGVANIEEQEARRVLLHEAMVYLDRSRARDKGSAPIYEELSGLYQGRMNTLPAHRGERLPRALDSIRRREVMLSALQVERTALIRLRDEGEIDDDVMRTLQRELDLAESRTHTGSM